MRNFTVSLLLTVLVTGSTALGIGFIGTPTSKLEKGQVGIGFDYSYSSVNPAASSMSRQHELSTFWNDKPLKSFSWEDSYKLNLDDLNVSRYYGVISYGVLDFWDVDLKLGMADVKGDSATPLFSAGHNFDNEFAIGWGTRLTFYEKDNIAWGFTAQMNWLNTDWGRSRPLCKDHAAYTRDIKLKTYDLVLAVGPTIDFGGWRLYGGPYYYYLYGDIKEVRTLSTSLGRLSTLTTSSASGNVSADGFGGFLGVEVDLFKNTSLSCEASMMNRGWALGASVVYRF